MLPVSQSAEQFLRAAATVSQTSVADEFFFGFHIVQYLRYPTAQHYDRRRLGNHVAEHGSRPRRWLPDTRRRMVSHEDDYVRPPFPNPTRDVHLPIVIIVIAVLGYECVY